MDDERRDVTIRPPAARASVAQPAAQLVTREPAIIAAAAGKASDAELIADLTRENRRLQAEKATLQLAVTTVSNLAVTLVLDAINRGAMVEGPDTIRVPFELHTRSVGRKLMLSQDPPNERGDLMARVISSDRGLDNDFETGRD